MPEAAKVVDIKEKSTKDSRTVILEHSANELVFAVVGHVGSGTSAIAETLANLLREKVDGEAFEVEIVKATTGISSWAKARGKSLPALVNGKKTLAMVEEFQNLGDEMRKPGDYTAVAKCFVSSIRQLRAKKQNVDPEPNIPIIPDGSPRAYILDSIRHPAEVELLRHIYQDAFVLIGVVCEESKRLGRVVEKYPEAGQTLAKLFMQRDAKATEKHGQRVSDAFHLADFFVDNTADRHRDDGSPNNDWDIVEKLSRLMKIIRHSDIVRPELSETAMLHAHGAAMRSACLSRQVGAALIDRTGNVLATGCNEVPKAGGGVYGDGFPDDNHQDHRCAYRTLQGHDAPFCSSTKEQNRIVDTLVNSIAAIKAITEDERIKISKLFKIGRIGQLLEFSRAVHAEMDVIITAARKGITTVGSRMFVTTFPCHYCARHIVSAGIDEVQYIEPYPKSQALDLHADSIEVTASKWRIPSKQVIAIQTVDGSVSKNNPPKVLFRPFTGVSPRLYRRAFGKDRDLKNDDTGDLKVSNPHWGSPWHLRRMSYAQLEAELSFEE
jgi:deoxycytidylate deaminase